MKVKEIVFKLKKNTIFIIKLNDRKLYQGNTKMFGNGIIKYLECNVSKYNYENKLCFIYLSDNSQE